VNTLGLGTGIIYFGADYERNNASRFKGVFRQSVALASIASVTIGITLYLLSPILARHVFQKPEAASVIRTFAPALPVYAIFILGDGTTRLSKRMQYSVYSDIGSAVFVLALFCGLFALGWGLKGAIVATVGGMAVGALMSIYFIRSLFPGIFAKEISSEWIGNEILAFSVPVGLAGLASLLLAFMDRLFVASFCSLAETGIYQVASQIPILFAIIFGAFDSIFSPMVADLHARGENHRLAELHGVCAKWRMYACAPLLLVILFAPGQLVTCMYGKAYASAALPLIILSAGQLFAFVAGTSQTMLAMTGRQTTYVSIVVSALVIDVALNFVLVPRLGIVGAASASALSAILLNFTAAIALKRHTSISLLDPRYAKSVGATSFAAGILYVARPLAMSEPGMKVVVTAVIGFATFAGCLVGLGLDAEDWDVLEMIRKGLR
jgi:O-antigen/teichoic acid export membrane protein